MNSDPGDFEALRKLMALKRHEQPPREYLHELSDNIIHRIENGEGRMNLWDKLSANFTLRPGLVYAFGLTLCGAIGVTLYSVKQETRDLADNATGVILRTPTPAPELSSQMAAANSLNPPIHVANWLRNTNPTIETQPQLSLFAPSHNALPVSYQGN